MHYSYALFLCIIPYFHYWKILKTLVQLILNSTWPHVITYTNSAHFSFKTATGHVTLNISCIYEIHFYFLSHLCNS